ncbi:hypothetical protein SELMODRAFT_407174 [Selaginella moellendorffii]|uniref:Fungal-type protein kinase domain-containing protein n=1 Tax=Selaginella moellendorffii TaxID=88036 RepID=D8R452_SELML|nr:hypothetical protein SELMODRAFT_407174 [Selaginella moellendorffii]
MATVAHSTDSLLLQITHESPLEDGPKLGAHSFFWLGLEAMDDVFSTPVRIVYVHPAEERGRNVDDLRAKVAFRVVPSDIKNLGDLVNWLKTVLKVDAVLSSKGWMEIPTPDPGAHLPPTFELHLRKALFTDASDNSKEWARTVLQPFPFAVLDVAGLRRALEEPLPLPLPVGPATYATLDPSYATQFIPTNQYPAERISGCVTNFMNSRVALGMSENLLQSIWDSAFCNLWMELLYLSEITSIQFNRNVTDHSGASTTNVSPDLLLWILNRLCVTFEEKRVTLEEAYQDLINKLGVLPLQYYGPVQWIVGVALAGVVKVRAERYNVVIQSVGYEQMISSEEDLWPAIQSALHGLHALHQAGLVHRDIRWKNILKLPASNGSWMLIDLETVWKTDCTPSCWLRAWDDNTLVDGVYTRSSDLYLVGRLMESFRDLSPEAKEFQAKLLRHEFLSAQEALRVDGNGKYSFSVDVILRIYHLFVVIHSAGLDQNKSLLG